MLSAILLFGQNDSFEAGKTGQLVLISINRMILTLTVSSFRESSLHRRD